MSLAHTAANIHSQILAQVPGQDLNPQAPGDFGEKVDRSLNFGVYIGLVVSMVLSRREGTSEEATAAALRVGVGCLVIGGAGTIVAALI